MKMFLFLMLLAFANNIIAQAICKDDAQCADGQFCKKSTYSCHRCLECYELNRSPLPQLSVNACIKSDDDCGPCLESFTKNRRSKCVSPEEKSIFSPVSFWVTCAAIGLLISVFFIQVIINMNIYEIVGYYIPKPPLFLESSITPAYSVIKVGVENFIDKTQDLIV